MATQTDYRDTLGAAMSAADQAQQQAAASLVAWVIDLTLTQNGPVVFSGAPQAAELAAPNAQVGDRVYVHRRGKPTINGIVVVGGILIESAGLVTAAGKVEIACVMPAVAANQTLTLPLRLIGYRPS